MAAPPNLEDRALPNVAPVTGDQQGMSPSTVVATAATDLPGAGEDVTGGTKGSRKGQGHR